MALWLEKKGNFGNDNFVVISRKANKKWPKSPKFENHEFGKNKTWVISKVFLMM